MLVKSQIKFWVFGAVGAVGLYILLTAVLGTQIGLGLTLIGATVMAMVLGVTWNVEKDGETAATYARRARDEKARQEYLGVVQNGVKQIEAPKQPTEHAE